MTRHSNARADVRPLPEPPPPGVLVRTEWTSVIWQQGCGEWVGIAPNGSRPCAQWRDIAGGKFGPMEWLIPVPAAAGDGDPYEQLGVMLDQLLQPLLDAMEHLAGAAVSGFRALLGEAVRRGERSGGRADGV